MNPSIKIPMGMGAAALGLLLALSAASPGLAQSASGFIRPGGKAGQFFSSPIQPPASASRDRSHAVATCHCAMMKGDGPMQAQCTGMTGERPGSSGKHPGGTGGR